MNISTKSAGLTPRHMLLALAVAFIWGTNFVVIKLGLAHLPPFLFATLRFALAAFPAMLFFKRPATSWRNLIAYGLLIGVGQFGLLFFAMTRFIAPGLASLLIQTQVFITIGLAMLLSGDHPRRYQIVATLIAAAGIALIASHTDGHSTALGMMLVLGAALSWSVANIVSRSAGKINPLGYVAWSSAFAVPPLALLSWSLEGWPAIRSGLLAADTTTWLAVLWQSLGNSIIGYGAWAWLLARYPAASVTPFALLVPVFGMAASAWYLSEPMPGWKLAATALVLAGLALNVLWPGLRAMLVRRTKMP